MGSSQPDSDPFLPFGYAVDPTQESLFDAPDPAPGAPLLSETDSKFLSSFFEDLTANQYNMPSFGEGLNFSDAWLDLPPQFMGTATSFGPQSGSLDAPGEQSYASTSHNNGSSHANGNPQLELQRMMSGSSLMPPPPPPPSQPQQFQPQQHSDDVLSAAATLLQNGSGSRGSVSSSKAPDSPQSRRPVGYPVGHLRHQPMEEFKEENRRSSLVTEHDNTFTEWMWGSKERTPVRKTNMGDIQWGSDSNFGPAQGYVPEPNKESVESQQQTQLKCLECLEVNKSAANTRPSSPVNGRSPQDARDASDYVKREDDPNAPPRKRRKSKNVKEAVDEDDDDDASFSKSGKKRKPRSERTGTSPLSDATASSRRRKSTANGAKPPRENLSEEQKRENHIRSEQKRRTLIKEGFDDLGDLVPGLKGGGFSKSTTLAMAAEWLEELLRGNKALAGQMASLGGH
ncbi:bHLH family transcription factor [Purpureocillium lavendulum]|uniref:BHLH family transcription factor n=1 Tax=Purpureocillium lavendulum TaxID=1247861 RepID=A0AB34FUA3_9HYPO|nr:bHLH family transcription factor [Purpureocillium lavendulum]